MASALADGEAKVDAVGGLAARLSRSSVGEPPSVPAHLANRELRIIGRQAGSGFRTEPFLDAMGSVTDQSFVI